MDATSFHVCFNRSAAASRVCVRARPDIRRQGRRLVQFLVAVAFLTTNAFAGEPGTVSVFVVPSQTVHIDTGGDTAPARFRLSLNFQAESRSPAQSAHPGGANVVFFDGSVRFLKATAAQVIVDRAGGVQEIRAEMVDTQTGYAWIVQILPFIEQDNLYDVFLTDGQVRYEFSALGHLLPLRAADPAPDVCSPEATDVFRPDPRERFGHLDGDGERADGVWGLRVSPGDRRMYFADDSAVLTDVTSDGVLKLAWPMTEVRIGSDQTRQVSIVQALLEVPINHLLSRGGPASSAAVCMSLARDGNVFAVWQTVGFFEVVDDSTGVPRLRFFAIVDRTSF